MNDFEKALEFLAEALERIASKELDEETVEFLRKVSFFLEKKQGDNK